MVLYCAVKRDTLFDTTYLANSQNSFSENLGIISIS